MKNGLIIINKPKGISSHSVVSRVKRALGVKKAGHTGTLDPMATGVLPVLVERGVKASEYMLSEDKHYRATLLLGITTDTEDKRAPCSHRATTCRAKARFWKSFCPCLENLCKRRLCILQ